MSAIELFDIYPFKMSVLPYLVPKEWIALRSAILNNWWFPRTAKFPSDSNVKKIYESYQRQRKKINRDFL